MVPSISLINTLKLNMPKIKRSIFDKTTSSKPNVYFIFTVCRHLDSENFRGGKKFSLTEICLGFYLIWEGKVWLRIVRVDKMINDSFRSTFLTYFIIWRFFLNMKFLSFNLVNIVANNKLINIFMTSFLIEQKFYQGSVEKESEVHSSVIYSGTKNSWLNIIEGTW